MRTEHKLTVFTLADGTAITTRSALETRWAIFFNELGLQWKYEPDRIVRYLPDFHVEGLGFVEIKPTLELLIKESSNKIKEAALRHPADKFYIFVGSKVCFDTVAIYQGNLLFSPTYRHIKQHLHDILCSDSGQKFSGCAGFDDHIEVSMNRANRAKLDHFASVSKVLELETVPKLKAELNR